MVIGSSQSCSPQTGRRSEFCSPLPLPREGHYNGSCCGVSEASVELWNMVVDSMGTLMPGCTPGLAVVLEDRGHRVPYICPGELERAEGLPRQESTALLFSL